MKAAVIGSGVGGLTAAALLAKAGHDVTVFEQWPRIGGVTATLERDGFRWDLGPLLIAGLAPSEPVGRVLSALARRACRIGHRCGACGSWVRKAKAVPAWAT